MPEPLHGHMPPAADIETVLADPDGACPDCVRLVIEQLRAELAEWRTSYGKSTAELAMETDRARQAEAERDRLAEQVKGVRDRHRTPAERDDPDHPLYSCGLHSPCPTRRALDEEATP